MNRATGSARIFSSSCSYQPSAMAETMQAWSRITPALLGVGSPGP
ncbi:hypothetical protein ACFYPA_28770 [Streptomyces sp. NPDC005775]